MFGIFWFSNYTCEIYSLKQINKTSLPISEQVFLQRNCLPPGAIRYISTLLAARWCAPSKCLLFSQARSVRWLGQNTISPRGSCLNQLFQQQGKGRDSVSTTAYRNCLMDSSGQMLESAVPAARKGEGFCVNYCIPQLPNGQLRSDCLNQQFLLPGMGRDSVSTTAYRSCLMDSSGQMLESAVPAARKGEGFCVNYCIPQLPNGQLRSDCLNRAF